MLESDVAILGLMQRQIIFGFLQVDVDRVFSPPCEPIVLSPHKVVLNAAGRHVNGHI